MKQPTLILISILLPTLVAGQIINPGCNDLTVENIQMDDDTANLMKVTVSNSCSTCTPNNCVYMEVRVIRTVVPFDTIASSNCYCEFSPPNGGGQRTYSLTATVTSLPPLNEIRFSHPCGSFGGCDTVPFSPTLGILANEIYNSINIYPNPFIDTISITIQQQNAKQSSILIRNMFGQPVFSEQVNNLKSNYTRTFELSELAKGIYLLDVIVDGARTVKMVLKE